MIHRSAGLAAAVLALVLLAGCTAARPASPPRITSAPPAPGASPRPAAPVSRIGASCAQLLTLDELQASLSSPVTVRDDGTVPREFTGAVLQQAGGQRCAWGGDDRTDSMYNTGLSLTVLPDAASDYAAAVAADPPAAPLAQVFGTASSIQCDEPDPICVGDVLVGATWIEFTLSDEHRSGSAISALTAVLQLLVPRVAAAHGTPNGWAPPPEALDAIPCSDALGSTVVGAPATVRTADDRTDIDAVAERHAGVASCAWSTGGSSDVALDVEVLPGGAWAFEPLAGSSPSVLFIGPLTPVEVAGSQGALQGCGDGCLAVLSDRGSLLSAGGYPKDQTAFAPQLARLVAAVAS